jgi:uncharacterized protein YegL
MAAQLKAEFAVNPEQRCACLLLLDTSGSMSGQRIGDLNAGLKTLIEELRGDELAKERVDLAMMTFDSQVKLVRDFGSPASYEAPTLTAQNETFLGAGIQEALKRLDARKQDYRTHGIPYYRPWLFILTDGSPQGEPPAVVEEAQQILKRAQEEKRVKVFPIGVGEDVDMGRLAEITQPATPVRLNAARFREMFVWLSRSIEQVAHSQEVNAQVALPPPDWIQA